MELNEQQQALGPEGKGLDTSCHTAGFCEVDRILFFRMIFFRMIFCSMKNTHFLKSALLLAGFLLLLTRGTVLAQNPSGAGLNNPVLAQNISGEGLSGPSDMGTYTLTSHPDGRPGYLLRYSDLDMDFELSLEGYVLTVSRPGGAFRAEYAWLRSGVLMLVNGLDPSADLPVPATSGAGTPSSVAGGAGSGAAGSGLGGSAPGAEGSNTVASDYRSFAPEQTWLFELKTLLEQQAGVNGVTWEQAPQTVCVQYADLVVASLFRGPRPLAAVELMKPDWPEPFQFIGLPAFDEQPAEWWNKIRASAARKQEGSFLSGNYALVSPDLGLSLAASSGWIALASAAYSPEEGFAGKSNIPYGMVLNSPWDSALALLPGYWGFLQTQNGGPAGRNHIHTTPLLPGLALILTQTTDSASLIGLTMVYQPFMQGLNPPTVLPPVAKTEEVPRAVAALFWNAGLDWGLWDEHPDAVLPLTPPGFTLLVSGQVPAVALRNGRFFQSGLCPGSDSPVQALCASLLVRQTLERLPAGYKVRIQFLDSAGNAVADLHSPELLTARWILHHEEDQERPRASYQHPHLEFVYARGSINPSGAAEGKGDFSAATTLEVAVYPAQERF